MKLFCDNCLVSAKGFRYIIYNEIVKCHCWTSFTKTSVAIYMSAKHEDYEKFNHRIYTPEQSVEDFRSSCFAFKVKGHTLSLYNRCIVPGFYISLGCVYSCVECEKNRIMSNEAFMYRKFKTVKDIIREIKNYGEEYEANAFIRCCRQMNNK